MWSESGAGRSPQCGAGLAQPMGSADGGARGRGAGAGLYFRAARRPRSAAEQSGRRGTSGTRRAAGWLEAERGRPRELGARTDGGASARPGAAGAGGHRGGSGCCCRTSPGDTAPDRALLQPSAAPQGPVRTRLRDGELGHGGGPSSGDPRAAAGGPATPGEKPPVCAAGRPLGSEASGWRGLGHDAAPPAATATFRAVLPAERSPGHSGAAPGLEGEGGGLTAACGPGGAADAFSIPRCCPWSLSSGGWGGVCVCGGVRPPWKSKGRR